MFEAERDFQLTQAELARPWLEPSRHAVPGNLESIASGPFLAAILASIDRSRLNGHDAVRVLEADARMESYFASLKYESMAEVAFSPASGPQADVARGPEALEFASEEVGSVLHLTRRAADSELGFALSLRSALSRVAEALREGRIDVRRAKVFERELVGADAATAELVCDRVLDAASELTTGQLRARVQRLVMEAEPEAAEDRYQAGLCERALLDEANPDGTANLKGVSLPPDRVRAIRRKVNRLARKAKDAGDDRTMDQLRADIFLDLLQGKIAKPSKGSPRLDRGSVHLTASLETLARLAETPGELDGYGPVLADITRQVAQEQTAAEWTFSVSDDQGHLVHVGTTSKRPSKRVERRVRASYPTCVYPGCRMPSVDCDLDHRRPRSEGGATCPCNLAPLCRRHHRAKHEGGWRLEWTAVGHLWTSPLGHTYATPHHPP
ncbi:MAG: DUF222 domain-containing protein [Acidimicrobiia bacterium]|nr:DUF222 domain-containing protein [Acidimicrobiia bacterium]